MSSLTRTALSHARKVVTVAANVHRIAVLGGLRSWRRDLRLAAPALGSMTLLLLVGGVLTLIAIPLYGQVSEQVRQASVFRVYLESSPDPAAVSTLEVTLSEDRRVVDVREETPEDSLAAAARRPGLVDLAGLANGNPFPAALVVRVSDPRDVPAVAAGIADNPVVDPANPTSYDAEGFATLQRLAFGTALVGGALLLLLLGVFYGVTSNAVRAMAGARREELELMRLLGARGWMLRGPFVVQGMTTGAFAAVFASLCLLGIWFAASSLAREIYVSVLPGLGATQLGYVVAGVLAVGMGLGTLTGAFGLPRIRG